MIFKLFVMLQYISSSDLPPININRLSLDEKPQRLPLFKRIKKMLSEAVELKFKLSLQVQQKEIKKDVHIGARSW